MFNISPLTDQKTSVVQTAQVVWFFVSLSPMFLSADTQIVTEQ